MKMSVKTVLLFIFPICSLLFVQAEKGRLRNAEHKLGYIAEDHADFTADVDDDSATLSAADDDGDDFSETLVKLSPVGTVSPSSFSFFQEKLNFSSSLTHRTSHRDKSPSLLRVFKI